MGFLRNWRPRLKYADSSKRSSTENSRKKTLETTADGKIGVFDRGFSENEKVFAIIVTYHPDEVLLASTLTRLRTQVSGIVVVNNSETQLTQDCASGAQVMEVGWNSGIAAAQNQGAQEALLRGADFLLQLDQDTVIPDGLVDALIGAYRELEDCGVRIGIVAPVWVDEKSKYEPKPHVSRGQAFLEKYELRSSVISSGSLVAKWAFNELGGFREELFIDGVDHDFCFRLAAIRGVVAVVRSVRIEHSLGGGFTRLPGGFRIRNPEPVRLYYEYRNNIFLLKQTYSPFKWKVAMLLKMVVRLVVYPVFLDRGSERLRYICRGVVDGVKSKTGPLNITPPPIPRATMPWRKP